MYLEALEVESPAGPESSTRHVDEHELHRHFLARLRELENAGDQDAVKRLFDQWPSRLARFARYLAMLPRHLAPVDRQGGSVFAARALDQAMDCLDPSLPLVDRLELQRIVGGFVGGTEMIQSYGLENRLVRTERPRGPRLTELGRVFLRLRGKDSVRWLVTNEVIQNTGPNDSWHTSYDLIEEAVATDGITMHFFDGERYFGYSDQTLNRLTNLGVLVAWADGPEAEVFEYRVAKAMRDVAEAVLKQGPWHTAIRALLDDERAVALPGADASAAEATIEQTKLIAHDVRNALIPVRHDIEVLRELAVEPSQQQRIDNAKQGVVRVLDFVEAMVQASELITEPPTRCEIGAVVDEALSWIDTGQRVERIPLSEALYLQAPRARLARAISNVVGNALQATTATQPVRLSIERAGGVARVVVDDAGPGVPIEHRERIFLEGVTMRLDGIGSGFGLAFARRVVEGALHGKIWCEDSDLGGARFVIEVPETSP